MIATVIDHAAEAACQPATCRIGLLGLGNVGSAFARLTRDAADHLSARGIVPIVSTSLVRTANRERPAARFVAAVTDSHDAFFSAPVDIVVEAMGGVEPAFTLVRRERRAAAPHLEPVRVAASIGRPESGWFVRMTGHAGHADMADLLGSYGIWCTRMARRGDRGYALTCQAAPDRIHAAFDALHCATGVAAAAFPAITEESQS